MPPPPPPPRRLVRENPFGDRGRLSPERFWGRETLLRRIFEELQKGASLSLVGESQVGKSSLLEMVRHLGPAKLQFEPTQFVYLDMQTVRNEDEFFEALCEELQLETSLRSIRLNSRLKKQDKRYIICIDEIEKMASRQHFTGDERSELRGFADSAEAPFSLVIASRSPLEMLFEDDPLRTSPLSGICEPLRVLPFTAAETAAFIKHRLANNAIQFTAEQIDDLYNATKGHPAQLQRAARDLYRQLEGG